MHIQYVYVIPCDIICKCSTDEYTICLCYTVRYNLHHVICYVHIPLYITCTCQTIIHDLYFGLVCWSLTSLYYSNGVNGHIETMPAREINPFTALSRIRSQFLRPQWSTSNHQRVDTTTPQTAQPSGLATWSVLTKSFVLLTRFLFFKDDVLGLNSLYHRYKGRTRCSRSRERWV